MPLVHECADPACPVLTMGTFCVEHERNARVEGDDLLTVPRSVPPARRLQAPGVRPRRNDSIGAYDSLRVRTCARL